MRRINPERQGRMSDKIQRELNNMRHLPLNYVYCLKENCPKEATCLHKILFQGHKEKDTTIQVLNPYLQHDDTCQHYREEGLTQLMAVGFMHQACRMGSETLKKFQAACMSSICKTVYYEMRAGNRLITPAEQLHIRQCAMQVGWDFPKNGFDQMYEVPVW